MSDIDKAKLENKFKEILNNSNSLTNDCDLPRIVEKEGNELLKEIYYDFQLKLKKITEAIIESIN